MSDKMNCIVCDKSFVKKVEKHVFCSKMCCDAHYRKTKKGITKIVPRTILCLACKKEIVVDNAVRKYCGKKCKNDYKNTLRDIKNKTTWKQQICPVCKILFLPKNTRAQEYCTKICKQKAFRLAHPEFIRSHMKRWYARNKERMAQYNKQPLRVQYRKAYDASPHGRLVHTLRDRLLKAIMLKQGVKSAHTFELIGADVPTVRKHLESKFKPGMSWENHGRDGWHIDHIKPCATFDLKLPEAQRECFHYTNLRPLWASENLRRPKRVIA